MLLQVQERQLIGLVSLICSLSCFRQLYTNWHYFCVWSFSKVH